MHGQDLKISGKRRELAKIMKLAVLHLFQYMSLVDCCLSWWN